MELTSFAITPSGLDMGAKRDLPNGILSTYAC